MKVVLKKDLKKIGRIGDVVDVNDGYARNYLIPQGIAEFASPDTVARLHDENRKSDEQGRREERRVAEVVRRLDKTTLNFELPADDKGHLYSGLKESQILDKIRTIEKDLPEKAHLLQYHPVKKVGRSKALLDLGFEQRTQVDLIIKSGNEEK